MLTGRFVSWQQQQATRLLTRGLLTPGSAPPASSVVTEDLVCEAAGAYRPRRPEATALYRLVEDHFEEYLRVREERFGLCHTPAFLRRAVEAFLGCGRLEGGFARVRCDSCTETRLLAFSCQTRNLCPSCQAKRAALLGEKLAEEILAEVPHTHVVFTVPRALRGLFERDRRLLGILSRCAYRALREHMQEALGVQDAVPGFVGSLQTFGSYAVNWHPHVHGIVSEGIFERDGTFHTLWTLGVDDIEQRFREAVIAELCKAERLSEEFALTLLGWEHSGFSVFAGRQLSPVQPRLIEETGSYIARPPIAGDLPQPLPDGRWCVATPPDPITGATEEVLDPLELLHRIVCQIPEPGAHMVRYYGAYSSRGRRVATEDAEAQEEHAGTEAAQNAQSQAGEDSEHTRARRRSWARLMRKILEVDPLQCPGCGEEMRIIAFITEPETVDRILKHIAGKRDPPRDEDEP